MQTLLWIMLLLCVLFAWWRDRMLLQESVADALVRIEDREEELKANSMQLVGTRLRMEDGMQQMGEKLKQLASALNANDDFSIAAPDDPLVVNWHEARDLSEAVDYLKAKLIADGKRPYAELISEKTVREAIKRAVNSNDARMPIIEATWPNYPANWARFKDRYLAVAEDGVWTDCSFAASYEDWNYIGADKLTYPGLRIGLDMQTADGGFSLPILDIYFGRFPPYPVHRHPNGSIPPGGTSTKLDRDQ